MPHVTCWAISLWRYRADTPVMHYLLPVAGFMAPEQCAGDGDVTPATDIYSMAAIGYFLLTDNRHSAPAR